MSFLSKKNSRKLFPSFHYLVPPVTLSLALFVPSPFLNLSTSTSFSLYSKYLLFSSSDLQNGFQHGDVPNTNPPDTNRATHMACAFYIHSQKWIKIGNLRISAIENGTCPIWRTAWVADEDIIKLKYLTAGYKNQAG